MAPLRTFLGRLLGGLLGEYVADWRAGRENARKIKAAVTENRARLAISEATHNQEWELRQLEGRDVWIRRLSFAMWSWPLFWAGLDPAGARAYFAGALATLPEWYVWGYLAVTGAVWGIAEFKAMGLGQKGGNA